METEDAEALWEYYRECPNSRRLGRILDHFRPMVNRLARTWGGGGNDRIVCQDDLVSAGNLGLAKAVEEYDPARGSFRHFAYLKVKYAIVDELRRYGVSSYKFHQGVRKESLEDENLLTMDATDLNFTEMLANCRGRITDQQMCVIVLHYAEGMALGHIGRMIGMAQWRVSELHQSALDELAECLHAA